MSVKRSSGTVSNIIVTILLVLLMLGAIGGLAVWLAREDGLTVYVQYGEKRYMTNTVNTSLGELNSGTHEFTVKSLIGESCDYAVEILPNSKVNFDFAVNDKRYKWSAVNCSQFFFIEKKKDGFKITVDDDMTVTSLLRNKYDGDILYCTVVDDVAEYFILSVKTSYGTIAMPFGFAIGEKQYPDNIGDSGNGDGDLIIELLPGGIIF